MIDKPPNGRVQARGGCGVEPSRADLFVRVSPSPAGGEAASPATDVGQNLFLPIYSYQILDLLNCQRGIFPMNHCVTVRAYRPQIS